MNHLDVVKKSIGKSFSRLPIFIQVYVDNTWKRFLRIQRAVLLRMTVLELSQRSPVCTELQILLKKCFLYPHQWQIYLRMAQTLNLWKKQAGKAAKILSLRVKTNKEATEISIKKVAD